MTATDAQECAGTAGELRYKVLVDDNFHYQDEGERSEHSVFSTADEAIAACKAIVDGALAS
jgi:hypothetical protein